MSTHAGDIFFDIKANDKPYKKTMGGLEQMTSIVTSKIGRMFSGIALGAGIGKLINKTATLGDTVDKMSQKLGMSRQAYQEWDFIMQRCGASIDSMTMAMKTLASGAETSKDAFKELGISQQEMANLSQEELFTRVVKGLQGVESTTRRTYLASQLLGRGATELGAVLNLSAQDLDDMRARVAQLGGIMSDTAVTNSAQFKDSLTDIKMAFRGIYNSIAEYVLPMLTSAVNNVIIPALLRVAQVVRFVFGAIRSLVSAVAKPFAGIGRAINGTLGKNTQKTMNDASTAIGGVGGNLGGVGKNAGKAKKAVQSLKRELMGFDQIVKLTKADANTGTSAGGGASGGGGSGGGLGDLGLGGLGVDDSTIAPLQKLSNIEIPQSLVDASEHLRESLGGLFETLYDFGTWVLDNVLKPLGEWFLNRGIPVQVETFASAIDLVNNALILIGDILEPLWEPLLKPVLMFFLDYHADKVELLGKGFGFLADALARAHETWTKLRQIGGELKITLNDKFSKAWKNIKDKWKGFKKSFGERKKQLAITLSDGFTKGWNKVKKVWNSLRSKAVTITLGFVDSIKSKWNSLARLVNNARAKGGLASKLLPNMPYLAEGGYVKANTPQLAMIGDNKTEGEIVAPESKLKQMAQEVAGSGSAETIALLKAILLAIGSLDTNVYLDGKEIKDNVVRRINQNTRQTGRLELIV